MRLPEVTPAGYRRITLVALDALVFIVLSGAAVRLTGSGLGCSDWPTCEQDRLVAPLEYHAMVEFVNRMVTGLVSVAVVLAVLGSLRRNPRRRDLVLLSWGLVAGVVGQIVLGGLTVLFELSPPFVMGHFLLSMVLIANAVLLHHRAGLRDRPSADQAGPRDDGAAPARRLAWAMVALTAAVLAAGTVVTGTGPHGGDPEVERLPLLVREVTQVHGVLAMALLLTAGATVVLAWRVPGVPRRAEWLLGALVAQITIGYVQYFNGVPVLLVGLHVLGATAVWIAALRLALGLDTRLTPEPLDPARDDRPVDVQAPGRETAEVSA